MPTNYFSNRFYAIYERIFMLSPEFVEEMKQKLLAAKQQLQDDLAGLPVHTEIDQDYEATADEAEVDFDNQGVRVKIAADLKKIDIALAKIDDGSYGLDDEGHEISQERLRVLPWADKAI